MPFCPVLQLNQMCYRRKLMSISDISSLFTFAGGLGMFLYGMNIMADGMQKTAGGKMSRFLGMLTNNRVAAIALGSRDHRNHPEQRRHHGHGGGLRQRRGPQSDPGRGRHHGRQHRYDHHRVDRVHEPAGRRVRDDAARVLRAPSSSVWVR